MHKLAAYIFVFLFGIISLACSSAPEPPVEPPPAQSEAAPTFADAASALAEGNRLLDENQTEQAIAAFKQAVQLDPNFPEPYFKLGIAYSLLEMQQEQAGIQTEPATNSKGEPAKTNSEKAFEKAVEVYQKWVKANPKDDVAYYNMGRAYAKLLKDEEALEAFEKAVELKPDDSEYQMELGGVLIILARYHEAIGPLKKAIELDDANVRAHELLEDAQAGRQRLDYKPKKDDNTNTAGNRNTAANSNVSSNSSTNSAPPRPPANTKPPERERVIVTRSPRPN